MNSSYLYRFFLVALVGAVSWSCDSKSKEGEHKGMKYVVRENGSGEKINDSSIVQVQMRVFNSADSLLQETYKEEIPALVNLRDSNNRKMPLVEILSKGTVGDSVTIFTQSDSIYKGQNAANRPPFIPVGSLIRQEFRVVKNYTMEEYLAVQEQMKQKQQQMQQEYMEEMMKQQQEMQLQADSISKTQVEYIENTYFVEKGIKNFKKTESGLLYTIDKQGKTDIQKGDKVKVNYEGTLLETGEKFDSSFDKGKPIEFPIGVGQVIKGWDEGIMLIGRGGKGYLYIPSNLGYGAQGSQGAIGPNAMLVFKVEVMEEITKAQAEQGQNMGGGK
ncbi:FKBP-type peptidyl-prolyl cis-trans isomerase [Bernardetia litoralis DSM 6794]|uniref:peptidylprolyl isomerase n=1 Tax=Bernardetia litoralis (strain ATCC 23117 / DSM 6794 / NBRC 15988 / NCIMB 1366 / Fx l1 / Sio-4) TaxID=880071 RepID=I4AGW7_BERLS|nr:FKBP-type peptidyl-prolyl cis-trans isomerase [Bernardetia litoralis]AFM03202.1 FKBP-type peptidyl-prolyl cis-trans isomerase [Bernardetia litoralis DSM 6794]